MLFVCRDSDPGIPDAEAQDYSLDTRCLRLHVDFYFSLLCEFDRIPDQIHNDLTEPGRISRDGIGDSRRHVKNELQTFLSCLYRKCLHDLPQTLPQVEA